MNLIIGIVMVIGCVIGGFMLGKGNPLALFQPNELLIIGGAAAGAFVISNPGKVMKAVASNLPRMMKGSMYKKDYYLDSLALLYDLLTKARKEGLMSLENDVENPESSPIFSKYPNVLSNHHAVEFLTDYLRLIVGGSIKNAFELDSLMDIELDTHHEEGTQPSAALTRVADALPGFGIVAAVLGIVITMAALGGPPEEIGHHVAAALVGTFLGILLAYGFIGPMSIAIEHLARDEAQYFKCLKTTLVASQQGYAPQIAVEFGRKAIFSTERPTFIELEEHVKRKPAAAG
ncbi:MAG: flagellar motor stator protein MotA [Gammaproteobacteria bacterium]|nr:flagellar motor stator protein MotA [Gammaproteobacteria bacterium]